MNSEDNVIRLGDVCYVLDAAPDKHWRAEDRAKYTNTECEVVALGPSFMAGGWRRIYSDFKVVMFDGEVAYFAKCRLRKKRGWRLPPGEHTFREERHCAEMADAQELAKRFRRAVADHIKNAT